MKSLLSIPLFKAPTNVFTNSWAACCGDAPTTGAADAPSVRAAVIRFLRNISGPAGLLLVLDDLQWAGADACDLLATLVRTATHIPLRVIGAYRDTELGASHAFEVATANLGRAELVTVIPLRPLHREDAAVLLRELLGHRTDAEHLMEEQIIERTGGVPFFLVSCAQGIRAGVGDSEVPWSLTQSVRQRVAHCSANAQTILRIAAVAGRSVSRSVLLSVAKMEEQGALAGLDEACSAGLLTPAAGHTYRFFHDVIREVVEADLGPEQRTRLHALIGLAMEEGAGPERAAVLAWHFSQGDKAERALQYSLMAGDHAVSVFANDEAEQHFRWATELAVDADPSRRAQVVEKYGLALRALARYDEALYWLEEAARLQHTAGNAEIEGLLIAHIGQVLGDLGRPREGIARIQQRIAYSPREDHSQSMAVLHVTLAGLFWSTGQYDQQFAAAELAAELARIRADDRVLLRAEVRRGQALRSLGRYEEAQRVLEQNIPAIEAAGDLELLAPALDSLSIVYLAAGEFHHEALHLRRGLEAAQQVGDPSIVAFMASKLGQNAYYQGEWNRAREYLEKAISVVRTSGAVWFAPYTLGALGGLFLATGDWKDAAEYLEESITISSDAAFQALENSQSLMGILEISEGRPEAALARLQRFTDGSRGQPSNSVGPRWVLAWSLLELGNDHTAAVIVAPEIARARAENDQLGLVHLLWIHALIAARQARWADAEGALAEVLTITRRMPYPYHEARALETYGSMQAQQGDRSAARQSWVEALVIFERLGARPYIERIERNLAEDEIRNHL